MLVVNGRGPVPRAATIERFGELGLDLVPGTGLLPACVPGAFGVWMLLLRDRQPAPAGRARAGRRARRGRVPGPAADRRGDPVRGAAVPRRGSGRPRPVWLARRRAPRRGRLHNPALAATWRRLLAEAEAASADRDGQVEAALAAFYEGFVAEAIDRFLATAKVLDVSGRRHGELLDGDDLAGWRASVEDGGGRASRLDGLQDRPLGARVGAAPAAAPARAGRPGGMGLGSGSITVTECAKLAFADREAWYGDPDAVDVPLTACSTGTTPTPAGPWPATRRRWSCAPGRRPGAPPARLGPAPGRDRGRPPSPPRGRGEPTFGDTCHIDVADRHGNLVAATPSGGWLQSSPIVPASASASAPGPECSGWRRGWPAPTPRGPADHPQPVRRPARRRALPGLRTRAATARTSGPSSSSWPAPLRPGSPAGDRRPHLPERALPRLVLARQADPGRLMVEARHGQPEHRGPAPTGPPGRGRRPLVAGPHLRRRSRPPSGFLVAAANPRGRQAAVDASSASTKVNEAARRSPRSRTSPSSNSGEKMPSRSGRLAGEVSWVVRTGPSGAWTLTWMWRVRPV